MDKNEVFEFISQQKTAFIASVNEQGYPIVRAMLAPRKIENNQIYFPASSNNMCHPLTPSPQSAFLAHSVAPLLRLASEKAFYCIPSLWQRP